MVEGILNPTFSTSLGGTNTYRRGAALKPFLLLRMASLGEDLLVTVNKLQDLVFNTIGNDSLDLPQIVSSDSW